MLCHSVTEYVETCQPTYGGNVLLATYGEEESGGGADCQTIPVNNCRNVAKPNCRKIADEQCRKVPNRECGRVPVKECRQVRGNSNYTLLAWTPGRLLCRARHIQIDTG